MAQSTKDKISQSLRGHKHTEATKKKISDGLKFYWRQIPSTPTDSHPVNEPSGLFEPTDNNNTSKPKNHA